MSAPRVTEGRGGFASRVLDWFDKSGRHDLPWQRPVTPYRVWVSEIMLQQTQVQTVIPYFERFMSAFPDLHALADASLDEVLSDWAGLGYYARARNLHRAAQRVRDEHDGVLPATLDALLALPGIGRSTAGAILSLAHGQRHAVLDGNVKRVLARYHGVDGWPGRSDVARMLWTQAESCLPEVRPGDYNQAMMDLGATCCTRRRPGCGECPLSSGCVAHASGEETRFPGGRPKRELPVRTTRMLLIADECRGLLLERRPPAGVWGGLWCLPELAQDAAIETWCRTELGCAGAERAVLPTRRHQFTHFRLDIAPVLVDVVDGSRVVLDGDRRLWYKPGTGRLPGVPKPIKDLLREYEEISA